MTAWAGATAIVTGAASGIGRALSLAMARRGARVVVTDVDQDGAARVAAECGAEAMACRLDVRDASAVAERIEAIHRERGRLDFLFNNAGIGMGGETQDLALEHWERIIDVNIRGVVHGIRAAYPIMVRQGSGHIVNTASLAGLIPAPLLTPYAMTKHAVVGLSVSLRIEGAPLGVRVSALCPGAVDTPILDRDTPPDLPAIPSRSDGRGFFARMGVVPYPATTLADEALAAVERNEGVIVLPRDARRRWRATRWFPSLVARRGAKIIAAERAYRVSAQP